MLVYLGVQGPPFPGGPQTVFGKRKLSVGNLGLYQCITKDQ